VGDVCKLSAGVRPALTVKLRQIGLTTGTGRYENPGRFAAALLEIQVKAFKEMLQIRYHSRAALRYTGDAIAKHSGLIPLQAAP
jgi:hypothetical protein